MVEANSRIHGIVVDWAVDQTQWTLSWAHFSAPPQVSKWPWQGLPVCTHANGQFAYVNTSTEALSHNCGTHYTKAFKGPLHWLSSHSCLKGQRWWNALEFITKDQMVLCGLYNGWDAHLKPIELVWKLLITSLVSYCLLNHLDLMEHDVYAYNSRLYMDTFTDNRNGIIDQSE